MFARMLASGLGAILCARAFALEVTQDYVINLDNLQAGQTINVRDRATLTIDFSQDSVFGVGTIVLWDHAWLVVRTGRVNGEIQIQGDNRLDLRGGRFAQRLTGAGDARINVRGGQFSGLWSFTGGAQHVRMIGGRGVGLSGANVSLDFYSPYPLYSLDATRALLAGFPSSVPTISNSTASVAAGVPWRMFSSAFQAGDSNRDGVIDVADVNLVRNAYGRTTVDLLNSYLGETLPYDGRVDIDDLNRVRNAFGEAAPDDRASAASLGELQSVDAGQSAPIARLVPEPAANFLVAIALGAVAMFLVARR